MLTRRTFLEQFGLVGGSTLVMSAMRSWDLMAAQAGPRPVLTGRPKGTTVIVLGAGLSGLVAGYELGKLGYKVRILEARDRVGGVNWTLRRGATHTETGPNGETQVCNFDEGLYLNGGPWRLPHWHTGVLGYCKELGVPLELFVNENESSYFYYEGDNIGPLANTRVRLREVKADMLGYTCELMAKAVNQDALDLPLTKDDKERFVTFLVSEGYLDSADRAYRKNSGRGPGDPHDFRTLLQSGFANRIRSVLDGTGQAPMFQPVGGMDQIPKAFQKKLGDQITLGAEITSIRQGTSDVKVAFKNVKTGAMTEVSADYCVSCLPLSILSRLDANLSPETMAAVKATPYSPSAKMGLQMKRRFWEEDDRIFGGHLYSNLPFGNFSYPSTGFFGDKGVLLGFYGNGQMAGVIDMPIQRRIEHVLTHASKVHPQIRTEYETAYCTFWERVPYSMGAFAGGGGGGNANRLSALGKPDNRIFLGCAAVSGNGGWLEGAVGGAWKQVKQLHECVMTAAVALLVAAVCAAPAAAQHVKHIQTKESGIATGVWVGDMLYLSGQLPNPVTPADREKGTPAVYGNTQTQTESVFAKIEGLLKEQGLDMGNVVMMRVYMAADPAMGNKLDFAGMNTAYAKYFGTPAQPNKPARSTFQAAALVAQGALVEIEVQAARTK